MEILIKVLLTMVFLLIAVNDGYKRRIPDRMVLLVVILGIGLAVTERDVAISERISGAFAVSVPMAFVMFWVPGAFGGGDIKFTAAAGIALGFRNVIAGSAAAVLLCGLYCIYLLIKKKADRKRTFAFGPFLCLGMFLAMIWGDGWTAWFWGG